MWHNWLRRYCLRVLFLFLWQLSLTVWQIWLCTGWKHTCVSFVELVLTMSPWFWLSNMEHACLWAGSLWQLKLNWFWPIFILFTESTTTTLPLWELCGSPRYGSDWGIWLSISMLLMTIRPHALLTTLHNT